MALGRRRRERGGIDAWPGYVDALSTLLMVIIFVLLVFVLAQSFLSVTLSSRDRALDRLNRQVSELAELLALERGQAEELRGALGRGAEELRTATAARDAALRSLALLRDERDRLALERDGTRADRDRLAARITDLASADGTAAIPAKTTTPGTTYDLDLASYTITTGGVVANLIDLRTWAGAPDMPARRAYLHRRRVFAEFAGGVGIQSSTSGLTVGLGFGTISGSSGLVTSVSATADLLRLVTQTSNGAYAGVVTGEGAAARAILRPDQSPMMIFEGIPSAAAAALAVWMAGFFEASTPTATKNGAYLRRVTTGNVFFVTRQGGSETTTDLGNITTRRQLIIESPDKGVTWYCIDAEDGSVLATHTGNVPTAATALAFGTAILNNTTSAVTADPAYMRVEANTL
jgi:chemotaxis protein MotB